MAETPENARRFVAFVRAINVGGRNSLAMADLRSTCERIGCTEVSTYIQSGNVLLQSTMDTAALATELEHAIAETSPISPRVIVRDIVELQRVLDDNPYTDTSDRFVHIGFMSATPTPQALDDLGERDCAPERYAVSGTEIYLDYVEGAGRSRKLGRIPFERILGVAITARSLRTVAKLRDLAAS